MKKAILPVVVVFFAGLVGCAGVNVKPDEFAPVATGTIDKENMPTEAQLNGGASKVVVFEAIDKARASLPRIATAMDGAIAQDLNHAGAEVVDRSLAKKLGQEIALAETGGESNYTGPAIANFAFKPIIHSSQVTYKHNAASSWTDDDGKVHHVPANCVHSGSVTGVMNIYEIPSLRHVKGVNFAGGSSKKTETRDTLCRVSGSGQNEFLLTSAAAAAVHNSSAIFKDIVTPSAYVTERLQKGDEGEGKGIIVTTLGTTFGAGKCTKIIVYRVETVTNKLTKKESTRSYPIAKGRVTSQIEQDYSWVSLSEGFEKVRIGHKLRVDYTNNFIGGFKDLFCGIFG